MSNLKHKEFDDGDKLIDFVNKNNINMYKIQQITERKYTSHLYYWEDDAEVSNDERRNLNQERGLKR